MPPRVAVVMCVHNGWPYLPEAVESVLGQDRPVDRFVIVDDASDDEGVAYLDALTDPRVTVLRNDGCRGPGAAAQRGVEACDCELVARLDADDVAEPWRIGLQVSYMESHPETSMLCTSAQLIDESGAVNGRYGVVRQPVVLEWELAFRNPVVQSTVIFRKAAFDAVGGYSDLRVAEDYDLWSRLVRGGGRLGSLSAAGVRLRKHGGQVSEHRRGEMLQATVGIAAANIASLTGESPDPRSVLLLVDTRSADPGRAPLAVDLLAEVTGAYLSGHEARPDARREISARALERTQQIVAASGLGREASARALRSCVAGAGSLGLTTVRGAQAWARLVAPEPLIAAGRRLRHRGRP